MAIPLSVDSSVYNYPENEDENWGTQATQWAQAVTNVISFLRSPTAPLADVGQIRMGNADTIAFRNVADDGNLRLYTNGQDKLFFNNGVTDFDLSSAAAGNVNGPVTSTDNAIPRWDSVSGTILQDSSVLLDDSDNITGINDLTVVNSATISEVTISNENDIVVPYKVVLQSTATTTYTPTTVVESTPIDLSNIVPGDIVTAVAGSNATVVSVDDGTDTITVDAWTPSQPADTETYQIRRGGTITANNFGVVPIGTIIDFWNAGATLTLPDNFVKCDGQVIEDAESPLNGVTLPDLNVADGVYTIGTDAASHNTTIDGDANHSVSVGNHTHTGPNHNHTDGDLYARIGLYANSNLAENDQGILLDTAASASWTPDSGSFGWADTGNGTASTDSRSTGVVVSGNTGNAGTGNTGSGGSHTVNIKGASLPVWKVIRIK